MDNKNLTVTLELERPEDVENRPALFNEIFSYVGTLFKDGNSYKNGCRITYVGWGRISEERDAYEEALIANGIDPKEAIQIYK